MGLVFWCVLVVFFYERASPQERRRGARLQRQSCIRDSRRVQPRPGKGLAPRDEDSARCGRDPQAGVLSVQHAAEQSARAANAPLPPAARASRATGQAAAAALQGSGSGSEPDAASGRANPQADVLSRRRRLRAAADADAPPV